MSAIQQMIMAAYGAAVWTPATLFAASEQGVWYDPSDFSTMFQDSAGTTPVTAVGQPVGRILDKSGRGNHATQATATKRPVLSARVNLLTKTEQFDDVGWGKSACTISANVETAPDGTLTADRINLTPTNTVHGAFVGVTTVAAASYTLSAYAKAGTSSVLFLGSNVSSEPFAYFDVSGVGSVGNVQTGCTASITAVGGGWFRCVVVGPAFDADTRFALFIAQSAGTIIFNGAGTETIFIWGADLRVANAGVGLPAYQRVNTATEYDTVGFPHYLAFDGVDDALVTPSINFTSTDKMTVWAGVRKLSDATVGMLAELSSNAAGSDGAFYISAPESGANYGVRTRGTINTAGYNHTAFAAPITSSISIALDNAGASGLPANCVFTRFNAVLNTANPAGSTTAAGNFGNYPLYIGARGGTSLYFNGRIYSMIVRGALSDAAQIAAAEAYVNGKTGAY